MTQAQCEKENTEKSRYVEAKDRVGNQIRRRKHHATHLLPFTLKEACNIAPDSPQPPLFSYHNLERELGVKDEVLKLEIPMREVVVVQKAYPWYATQQAVL